MKTSTDRKIQGSQAFQGVCAVASALVSSSLIALPVDSEGGGGADPSRQPSSLEKGEGESPAAHEEREGLGTISLNSRSPSAVPSAGVPAASSAGRQKCNKSTREAIETNALVIPTSHGPWKLLTRN